MDYAASQPLAKPATTLVWEDEQRLAQIPRAGASIVACNYPLGGLEAALLTRELLRYRSDVEVPTNERAACRHLQKGGLLLMFPAGAVATINLRKRSIEDRPWSNLLGRLALRYQAVCLPLHISARNSAIFYLAGLVHRRLPKWLLSRQVANKRGCNIEARAGEAIGPTQLRKLGDANAITQALRLSCDLLAREAAGRSQASLAETGDAIESDVDAEAILRRLRNLEPYRLLDRDGFSVYCAPHDELGCIMRQIAICRERTFRAVGEGTGRSFDSDQFDPCYWHLWIWDREARQIVGGYRMGMTDQIVRDHGMDRLFSHSLYKFDQSFLDDLGNPLEVGRSFVTLDYQRHPRALDLLWRGIGAFLVRHPQYHTLFGCLSISNEFTALARAFLADSLMSNFSVRRDWLQRVAPRLPMHVDGKLWTEKDLASLNSLAIIDKQLGNLDAGKHIPVLLRHYVNLRGKFVAFSINESFNHSLNGLILVDLRHSPEKYLTRYLGKEGCANFLRYWESGAEAA